MAVESPRKTRERKRSNKIKTMAEIEAETFLLRLRSTKISKSIATEKHLYFEIQFRGLNALEITEKTA